MNRHIWVCSHKGPVLVEACLGARKPPAAAAQLVSTSPALSDRRGRLAQRRMRSGRLRRCGSDQLVMQGHGHCAHLSLSLQQHIGGSSSAHHHLSQMPGRQCSLSVIQCGRWFITWRVNTCRRTCCCTGEVPRMKATLEQLIHDVSSNAETAAQLRRSFDQQLSWVYLPESI